MSTLRSKRYSSVLPVVKGLSLTVIFMVVDLTAVLTWRLFAEGRTNTQDVIPLSFSQARFLCFLFVPWCLSGDYYISTDHQFPVRRIKPVLKRSMLE